MSNDKFNRECPYEVTIGKNIAEARLKIGFDTIDEVAKVTGISEEDLQSIERGDIENHLDEIYTLLCLYECPTHEVFEGYFNSSKLSKTKAFDVSDCKDYIIDIIGFHKRLGGNSSSLETIPLTRGTQVDNSYYKNQSLISKAEITSKKLPLSTLSRRANAFLEKHSLHKLPINVYQAASDLGIKVSFEDFPSNFYMKLKGFCYRDDDIALIGLNKGHPAVLQRFTLAHELHHYLYDFIAGRYVCGPENEDTSLEWNAERFAAELLMPSKFMYKLVGTPLNVRYLTIGLVAKHFGVSYEAAAIRLSKFRLITDSKIACSHSYRKKDREKTRYLLDKHKKHLLAVFGLETGIEELFFDSDEYVRHTCGAYIHDRSPTICWQCGLGIAIRSNDYLNNSFRKSGADISSSTVISLREKRNNYKQLSFNLDVSS